MNVKLHTPKTLKTGSGLSSVKQFMLSLIATTISIVLTFGTAAVIDYHKKEAAKKEMVMMVINDFDQTIALAQNADSALRESRRLQQELAAHPEHFDSLHYKFPSLLIFAVEDFSGTVEKIFSSSIETFNTIGDVNFVNEVSSFYLTRSKYKELLIDKLRTQVLEKQVSQSLQTLMDVNYPEYVFDNWIFLEGLKDTRDKCMRMMKVSEKDMIKFTNKHKEEEVNTEVETRYMKMYNECDSFSTVLQQAREKLKN